jgi:hypothetical protein
LYTVAATVNGQVVTGQTTNLPAVMIAAPTGLALVNDTGPSATDGQTGDAHLTFAPVDQAAGYEYSLTGEAGTYLPLPSPASFLPQGLSPGFNSVFVRAYDAAGDRGPDALIVFDYDPAASSTAATTPSGGPQPVGYEYRVGTSGPFVPLGTAMTLTPAQEASSPVAIQIQAVGAGPVGVPEVLAPVPPSKGSAATQTIPTPTPAGGSTAASAVAQALTPSTWQQRQAWPNAAETVNLARQESWIRHPNPFRRIAAPIVARSTLASRHQRV